MMPTDGRMVIISGSSRCGKTTFIKGEVAGNDRVFAWDPEEQYAPMRGYRKISSRDGLLKAMQTPGPLRVAYVVGGDLKAEFDFWAGCALYAGRYIGPLVAIAEELADVSAPGKAPPNWGRLLRRGLKRTITIYAISQRWQEADKTALGNATEYVMFRQSSGDDAKYIARKTRVPVQLIDALLPYHYIRYECLTGTTTPGKMKYRPQKASKNP